jgi:hypothetical protein
MAVQSDLFEDPPQNPVSGVASKASPQGRLLRVRLHDGETVTTDWQNAQDMVRFGAGRILGEADAVLDQDEYEVEAATETVAVTEPEPTPLNDAEKAVAALEDLRTELRELGVEVDMRWGLKRLNAELDAARLTHGVVPDED